MSVNPLPIFSNDQFVTARDEIDRKYNVVVWRDLLQAFLVAVQNRAVDLTKSNPIPSTASPHLSAFASRLVQGDMDGMAQESVLAAYFFYYCLAQFRVADKVKVLDSICRPDFEDIMEKELKVVRIRLPICEGCLIFLGKLANCNSSLHYNFIVLPIQALEYISSRLVKEITPEKEASTTVPSPPSFRLMNLNQRKLKTGGDMLGEWCINVDVSFPLFSPTGPETSSADVHKAAVAYYQSMIHQRLLRFTFTLKSRSDLDSTVAMNVVKIPFPPEEIDDIAEDIPFPKLAFVRGGSNASPLPRDPAKYALPKAELRGPTISIPVCPTPLKETVTIGEGFKPHYKMKPKRLHFNQPVGSSRDSDGTFTMFAFFIIHVVRTECCNKENDSIRMDPKVWCLDANNQRVYAESSKLGTQINNDLDFPKFDWVAGNMEVGGTTNSNANSVMLVAKGMFSLKGKPGRDNWERSRVPHTLPQPLTMGVELVEDCTGCTYQVEMQHMDPPVTLPTLESVKKEWEIDDLMLFVHVDDLEHQKRSYLACYWEEDKFVIRRTNYSLCLTLTNFNEFSYLGWKTGENEIEISKQSFSHGADQCAVYALVDHSEFPPMIYGIRVELSNGTASAEGACHIALRGHHWIVKAPPKPTSSEGHSSSSLINKREAETECITPILKKEKSSQSRVASSRFTIMYKEVLGAGSFGTVYKAFDNESGESIAVKVCHISTTATANTGGGSSSSSEVMLGEEYELLTKLSHPNIVSVRAFHIHGPAVHIFMEWMPSGSVLNILQRTGHRLHEGVIRKFMRNALQGLNYLHQQGVLHLDIKPANLLVGSDGCVKLSDFGTSRLVNSSEGCGCPQKVVGTPAYMPPEMIHKGQAHQASDIWSLACSVVEMAAGEAPWSHLDPEIKKNALSLMFYIGNARGADHAPVVPSHLSSELQNILHQCFSTNAASRPSATRLLKDPYFLAPTLSVDAETWEDFGQRVTSDVNSMSVMASRGESDGPSWNSLHFSNPPTNIE